MFWRNWYKARAGKPADAALHSCIADNLIALSGKQLGNTVQESRFKSKGCPRQTQRPTLTSLLPTQCLANFKWVAHPTALAHWKPSPLFIFKAGIFSSAAQVSQLPSPHQRAGEGCTHLPDSWETEPLPLAITARAPPQQRAGRGSQRKDLASLHWTSEFLYQRDWKHKHTHANHPLSFRNWFVPQDRTGSCSHTRAQANGCDKLQELTSTVIIVRVHIWFPHPTDGQFQCWREIPDKAKQEECWST